MPQAGPPPPPGLEVDGLAVAPLPPQGLVAFARANAAFLVAGVVLCFVSSFGQTFFISVFAGEIMAAFDLTDGRWGLVYAIATTASAVATAWAGGLLDRFRIRHLAIAVSGLLALACLTMAAAGSVGMLLVAIFLLRLLGLGMMAQLSVVAMARWFVASRGKALSIASLGFALGQAVLPFVFVAALGVVPWRWLWVMAALAVLVPLPLVVRLLRAERTPQSLAAAPQAAGMGGRHWTRGAMLRHPLFWAVAPLLVGPPMFATALFFHQVHLTDAKGWDHVAYVALLPPFTAAMIAATLLSGAAIDRWGSGPLMATFLLPYAAAFAVMAAAQTLWGAGVALVALGLGSGMQATASNAFWAEYYGTRHLGAIKALAAALMVLGTAVGPLLSGLLIDAGHPLPAQMPAIAAYFVAAAALATAGILRERRRSGAAQVDVERP